jgi:tripartite-type tricarboxylate transporter receptor subunit TctC
VLALAASASMPAHAETARPIKIIVGMPPGGGVAVDREIAELYATPAGVLARARTIAGE